MDVDVEKEFEKLQNISKEPSTTKKRSYGTFKSFDLSQAIIKGVEKKGYKTPTPIQRKIIPLMMTGSDVLGMARTGSGKSAAFLLPALNRLHLSSRAASIQCIIVAPTRELCLQILKFAKEFGRFTALKIAVVVGGDSMEDQFRAIHANPNIVIATPGRLLHLVVEMNLKLNDVSHFIMDEADLIMESGLITQLRDILRRLPSTRQTAFFSATLPSSLVEFSKTGLRDPTLLRLDTDIKISPTVTNLFIHVREEQRLPLLIYLLTTKIKGNTVVFAQTRHHVDMIVEILKLHDIPTSFAYSSLDQVARRSQLDNFRKCKTSVMVVTDLAARGLDLPFLDNVINLYFPTSGKLYVHRVGRVGRCGRVGNAFSVVTPMDVPYLFDLMLFLGKTIHFDGESDNLLGVAPQSVMDEFSERLEGLIANSVDLLNMKRSADNCNVKLKSHRPDPSTESVRRAKKLDKAQLKCHPIFGVTEREEGKQSFMDGIRNFKPKNSMLELINKQKRSNSFTHTITAMTANKRKNNNEVPTVFDRDQPVPSAWHSEKGLELDMKFHKDVGEAAFDIAVTDEPRGTMAKMKWDRNRAKFVSTAKNSTPKIRTESGTYIEASYKTDHYKNWLKSNPNARAQVEESGTLQVMGLKQYRHNEKKPGKCAKTELKNTRMIIQERRRKEKKEKASKKFKKLRKAKGRKSKA